MSKVKTPKPEREVTDWPEPNRMFDSGWTNGLMQLDNWIRQNLKENVTTKAVRAELIALVGDSRPHGIYTEEMQEIRDGNG